MQGISKWKTQPNSPRDFLSEPADPRFIVCTWFPSEFCSIFSFSAKLRFSVSEEFLLQSLVFWDSYCPLQIGWASCLVMFRLLMFLFGRSQLGELSTLVESVTLLSWVKSFKFLSEMMQENWNEGVKQVALACLSNSAHNVCRVLFTVSTYSRQTLRNIFSQGFHRCSTKTMQIAQAASVKMLRTFSKKFFLSLFNLKKKFFCQSICFCNINGEKND